mgnify:CR=1 FL=1
MDRINKIGRTLIGYKSEYSKHYSPIVDESLIENGKNEGHVKDLYKTDYLNSEQHQNYRLVTNKEYYDYAVEKDNTILTDNGVTTVGELLAKLKLSEYDPYIPTNAKGEMTKEKIIVNYYYIKVAKVVVQFKDKFTGEVVYEMEVYEGYKGEEYKTVPPEIDGYILVIEEYPSNAEGKYETETQEVTYYYARKAKVEISYIDAETGAELLEKEYIEGKEGDSYTTEAKEVNYYKLQEVEKQEGKMEVVVTTDEETGMERVNNVTKVIYKYRKAYFDIAVDKTVKEIIVDGTNRSINNNKLAKVEIHRKEISEANVKVIYQIKVTNNGELPGSAVVADIIPKGLKFNSSDNKAWTPKGDRAFVETEELNPGESTTYEMILTWNGKDEIGTFTNKIEVADVENTPDYEEESTRNNNSEATVIIVTSTGIGVILSQINMTDVANVGILSFYFVLIYVFVIKRKRD